MTRSLDTGSAEKPPVTTAARVIAHPVWVGLLLGAAWGWIQVPKLLEGAVRIMDLRQWVDLLSYSGLANGLLWMLHGAIFGGLCALLCLVLPRLRRFVRPGPLGVGLFFAGMATFQAWVHTSEHMPRAAGIQPAWSVVMVVCWWIIFAGAYGVAHLAANTVVGRITASASRWVFLPVTLLLLASVMIQWFERPQLLPCTAGWEGVSADVYGPEDGKMNVVLVVLDTQRVDRLGCYGYERPTTPCLDRFAEDAMVFENHISNAVWTLPSHASMFTGLYPSEHGANWDHVWLEDRFSTMAEILGEMGYQTCGISSNLVVSPASNISQGFDFFDGPRNIYTARGNYLYKFLDRVLYPAGRVGRWLGKLTIQSQGAKYNNQMISRWLAQRDRERPFFLFVNYLEPHDPFRPTDPYRTLFVKPEDLRDSFRLNWDRVDDFAILKRDVYSAEDLEILSDTYDADTRFTDAYLGQFLDILAAEAPLDETLVIITSDHGENLGDHHLLRHAWCVYDSLAHVPLIIRYPARLEPGRYAEITQTVDLLPTVLDAVSGRPGEVASGRGHSLLGPGPVPETPPETSDVEESEPDSAELTGRVAIIEEPAPYRHWINIAQKKNLQLDRTPFEGKIYGVRQGPWKYIVYGDGRRELFRVADDRGELTNLIEMHPAIADQLADNLRQWQARLVPYQPSAGDTASGETDEETLSALRELGYIQ